MVVQQAGVWLRNYVTYAVSDAPIGAITVRANDASSIR